MTDQVYAEVVGLVFGEHDGCQCETCTEHWGIGYAHRILEVLGVESDEYRTFVLDVIAELRAVKGHVKDRELLERIITTTGDSLGEAKAELTV
jgi:hypothetical protein